MKSISIEATADKATTTITANDGGSVSWSMLREKRERVVFIGDQKETKIIALIQHIAGCGEDEAFELYQRIEDSMSVTDLMQIVDDHDF